MLKRSLLLLGALASCRSVAAPTDSVAPTSELAERAAAPAPQVNDSAPPAVPGAPSAPLTAPDAVELVPLQHVPADVLADVLAPPSKEPTRVQQNENEFCVLRLPEAWRAPPDAPWTVVADLARNAIVIRGTPEKVAELRKLALAIDRNTGTSKPRAP